MAAENLYIYSSVLYKSLSHNRSLFLNTSLIFRDTLSASKPGFSVCTHTEIPVLCRNLIIEDCKMSPKSLVNHGFIHDFTVFRIGNPGCLVKKITVRDEGWWGSYGCLVRVSLIGEYNVGDTSSASLKLSLRGAIFQIYFVHSKGKEIR